MTKDEAAIVSAYTGVLICDFSTLHKYVEEKMERPIFTHELADPHVVKTLKERSKADFVSIEIT